MMINTPKFPARLEVHTNLLLLYRGTQIADKIVVRARSLGLDAHYFATTLPGRGTPIADKRLARVRSLRLDAAE